MKLLEKEDVQKMLENHIRWLRGEVGGERICLENVDFGEFDFSFYTLESAIFNECDFSEASTIGTVVDGAQFTKCIFNENLKEFGRVFVC